MYELLLFIHSWTRWIVLIAIIYFFLRSLRGWRTGAPWTAQDHYFIWAFNQIFGYQVLFGLTLWIGLSPMTKAGIKNPNLILQDGAISFWVLRHALTMILAFGLFHAGRAKSKKVSTIQRFKVYALTFGMMLAMIASAIPWPWLSYGRLLFRWF